MTDEPVFVVGVTRSGTTLFEQILNRHPRLSIYHESHFLRRVWAHTDPASFDAAQARGALDKIFNLAREGLTIDAVERRFLETDQSLQALFDTILRLRMEHNGKARRGEKTPNNFWFLDVLFSWYPRAQVIFMIRNPHNVHGSFKKFRQAERMPRRDRQVFGRSFYWNYGARVLKESQASYPGQVMCVRFEDLVQEPEKVLPAVCSFLGEDYDEAMLEIRSVNSSFDSSAQKSGFRQETLNRQDQLSFYEKLLVDLLSGSYILANGYPLSVVPQGMVRLLEFIGFYSVLDAIHSTIRSRRRH